MSDYLWLRRPEVRQLLDRLVDRLDRAEQAESAIAQAIKLDRRTWPAFHDAPLEGDREILFSYVEQLARDGCFTLLLDRAQLGKAPYERNPRVRALNVARLRALTGRPERQKSYAELWREAVTGGLEAPEAIKAVALAHRIELAGYDADAIVARLNQVRALADSELLLREASARLFWGHSKVLDGRQGLVAALLGLPECPFPESRIQLLAYLPPDGFNAVLVIENQASFERAVHDATARFAGLALVWSSGFRASARRLRDANGTSVFLAQEGSMTPAGVSKLGSWRRNADIPTFFFGDLDYSGMGILRTLRNSFPDATAWRPGYEALLETLLEGGGHVAGAADKTGQCDPGSTGCPYADEHLLPAIRDASRFVDQELVA